MRIIAGSLKGRIFKSSDNSQTHPMSEKMRGAIFASLGDISGLEVLDAFSGTGALALEAISRNAAYVTVIESNLKNVELIKRNILSLGVKDHARVIRAQVETWATANKHCFDLVLVDPPYDHISLRAIEELSKLIKKGGVLALSWPGRLSLPQLTGLQLVKLNRFGDAQYGLYLRSVEALSISEKRSDGKNNTA